MEADGFQLVTRKKAARAPSKPICNKLQSEYEGFCTAEILERISCLKEKLREDEFFKNITATLEGALDTPPVHVLCYGIGRLGSCKIAQTQFALMLLLMDHFKIGEGVLYDPVLHSEEIMAIQSSSLSIIPYNEGCKRQLTQPTLVFMLHCGQSMYNHLLWANWNKKSLAHVILMGNKLSSYHERNSSRQLKEKSYYVYKAIDVCKEVTIKNSYEDHVIFNDIAIHVFTQDRLNSCPANMWEDCLEPIPDCSDNEIIL